MNSSSKVSNDTQAFLNKLKNKKAQLENLLRARARLDYEIQKLKKSLAKDQKRNNKLRLEAGKLQLAGQRCDYQVITESLGISDEDLTDYEEEVKHFLNLVSKSSEELRDVTTLLLEYPEP